MSNPDAHILDRLSEVIESRRGADPSTSQTAKILKKGPARAAKKVGEEAVEVAIEGVRGRRDKLVEESADLLYHLLVLWTTSDVKPAQVWSALEARMGRSGIAEKAARASNGGERA